MKRPYGFALIILGIVFLINQVWAGLPPNVPIVQDPALQKFISQLMFHLAEPTTGIFCPGALSTSENCEEFRGRIPRGCTMQRVDATVTTAPTGDILIDVNECSDVATCTSVWSTNQSRRLTIASGATTGTQNVFDDISITEGHYVGFDIDQATSGSNLTITLVCR